MKRLKTNNKGYALISILVISMFALVFLLALAGSLMSMSRADSTTKAKRLVEEAALIGIDYALQDLNSSITSGTTLFTIPNQQTEAVLTLPSAFLPDFPAGTTVKIKVRRLNATDRAFYKNYSNVNPQLDPTQSNTTDYDSPPRSNIPATIFDDGSNDLTRIVEVTASSGAAFKSARAVIEPNNFTTGSGPMPGSKIDYLNGGAAPTNSNSKALFPAAGIFAVSNLSINNTTVQIHPESNPLPGMTSIAQGVNNADGSKNYRLDVQSNRHANITGTTWIKGNLKISNNTSGSPSTVGVASDGAVIQGRALTKSGSSSYLGSTTGTSYLSTDEVRANADKDFAPSSPNRTGVNATQPVNTSTSANSLEQFKPLPVPSDPSAIDPYSVSGAISSGTKYVYVGKLPDGTLQDSFKISSLSLLGSTSPAPTKLDFNFLTGSSAAPAKIYIDGSSALTGVESGQALPVLNLDSHMFSNASGNPANMQIYYSGAQELKINLTNPASGPGRFDSLIYAPNAKVTITGRGNFYGAIVGDDVSISPNGGTLTMHMISNLNNITDSTAFTTPGGGIRVPYLKNNPDTSNVANQYQWKPTGTAGNTYTINPYNITSFETLNAKLVP